MNSYTHFIKLLHVSIFIGPQSVCSKLSPLSAPMPQVSGGSSKALFVTPFRRTVFDCSEQPHSPFLARSLNYTAV